MRILYFSLNLISLVFFIAGIIGFLKFKNRSTGRLLVLTACIVLAILMVVISNHIICGDLKESPILIETMQAFSLDADYGELVSSAFGNKKTEKILTFYRLLLFSAAPITGGAVIYDVLAGLSPELRMFFSKRKKLLVFSQLNSKSITLAENMYNSMNSKTRKTFVFTSCGEINDELKIRTEAIHAICLRENIDDCNSLSKSGYSLFFLINVDNSGEFDDLKNILTLSKLMERGNVWNKKFGAKLICFANSKEAAENIQAINSTYIKQGSPGGATLHLVRDNSQTACTLLKEHPLFEALGAPNEKGRPLRVLIIGNNRFSREMLCSVFWCGQILDHPLQITCAYTPTSEKKEEPEVAMWLNKLNPEILESCTPRTKCLAVDFKGSYSEEYASIGFVEEDISHISMDKLLSDERSFYRGTGEAVPLYKYDYFLIMEDDGRENAAIADNLRRALRFYADKSNHNKIIAVAVEDDSYADVLQTKYKILAEENNYAPKIYTFGNLSNRFDWNTVSADGYYSGEKDSGITESDLKHALADVSVTMDGLYNDWSRVARDYHLAYKMFSAGCNMDAFNANTKDTVREKLHYCDLIEQNEEISKKLAWLEHRRWCAFIRTQRFRQPAGLYEALKDVRDGKEENLTDSQMLEYSYKNTSALLHPCLVECSEKNDTPDMLDYVEKLRNLINSKRSGEKYESAKFSSIKKSDAPGGKNAPYLAKKEVYFMITGELLPKNDKEANIRWEKLLEDYPEITEYTNQNHVGYYSIDKIRKISKMNADE